MDNQKTTNNKSIYTLKTQDYSINASEKFVNSCHVFTDMFEVIEEDIDNNNKELIISNKYSEDEQKMYIKFFDDMDSLLVYTNNGEIVSYLDYITNFRNEYIENYTNTNSNPPHTDAIYIIINELGEDNISKIIEIDGFYNNKKVIRGIMLCIAILIRKLDSPKMYYETQENFKEREEKSQNYIQAIMDCVA